MFNPNFMPMQPMQQASLSQAFDPMAFMQQMQAQQQAQWAQQQQNFSQARAAQKAPAAAASSPYTSAQQALREALGIVSPTNQPIIGWPFGHGL